MIFQTQMRRVAEDDNEMMGAGSGSSALVPVCDADGSLTNRQVTDVSPATIFLRQRIVFLQSSLYSNGAQWQRRSCEELSTTTAASSAHEAEFVQPKQLKTRSSSKHTQRPTK